MGLAADANRIFVGGQRAVHEFRSVPAVAARLDPPGVHHAVYLLRNVHVTGYVDIHEMAFAGNQCWCVNTLFSCLCTLDTEHSFFPRWRPRFVTGRRRCRRGCARADSRARRLASGRAFCALALLGALGWPTTALRLTGREARVVSFPGTPLTAMRQRAQVPLQRLFRQPSVSLSSGRLQLASV